MKRRMRTTKRYSGRPDRQKEDAVFGAEPINAHLFNDGASTPERINASSPKAGYANGDRDCQARQDRISQSACVVQGFRYPTKCRGCNYATGN
jgi:hypothetical protein